MSLLWTAQIRSGSGIRERTGEIDYRPDTVRAVGIGGLLSVVADRLRDVGVEDAVHIGIDIRPRIGGRIDAS